MYKIPELAKYKHGKERKAFAERIERESRKTGWIDTDPKGYTKVAEEANKRNSDFRKTVKFIKKWKNLCEKQWEDFGLRSFHIEQVITGYFQGQKDLVIFDGIFKFFHDLKDVITAPKIKDRADNAKYIDKYLTGLKEGQKERIVRARDCFLHKLEQGKKAEDLLKPCLLERKDDGEKYLFDFGIPVLVRDNSAFKIHGKVREDGFRHGNVAELGILGKRRKIDFELAQHVSLDEEEYVMWKVQNDKCSSDVPPEQTRGEITKDGTLRKPECTAYAGSHYVEAFAIKNGVCVARSKVQVKIR